MKKIFVIAALAALTVSCTGLIDPKEDAVLDGATALNLDFWCAAPQTRVTKPGEDKYNENAILSLDYFIYASDADDAAAVMHERLTFDSGTVSSVSKTMDMGAYKSEHGVNGFVFAVVNIPESTEITGTETVATLLALKVPETEFNRLDGGKFKAQDSFVMVSDNDGSPLVPFTLVENTTVKAEVPLSRRAAKITIDINVADYYLEKHFDVDKVNGVYAQTWFPTVESIQVYMMNYTNEGTLDGEQIDVNNTTLFHPYNRYGFNAEVKDNEVVIGQTETDPGVHAMTVTGTPFYTYPSKWDSRSVNAPFIKIIVNWSAYDQKQEDGSIDLEDMDTPKTLNKEFYYKITIPDQVDFKSNYWYHIKLDLSVLGSEADDVYVTIPGEYSVVIWSDPDEVMGSELNSGRYLSIGGNKTQETENGITYETFVAYGDKVDIPVITSHPFEVVDGTPTSSYPTFVNQGTNSNPSYPDGHLTYSTNGNGNNFCITPDASYTFLTLEHNRVKGINDSGFNVKDVAPITYWFKIQHTDDASYYKYIKVIQYPSIYVQQLPGNNAFLNGFFEHLDGVPTDFSNPLRIGTTNVYRSASYAGTAFAHPAATSLGTTTNFNNTDEYYSVRSPYGNLGYHTSDGPDRMTLVTVTAFSETSKSYSLTNPTATYDYTIADPRVKNSWNEKLAPYLSGQSTITGTGNNRTITLYSTAWTNEGNIMVGSGNILDGTTGHYMAPIAPAFLISSRCGRPGSENTSTYPDNLEEAQQRCATYQEGGFPAGRWRLPTEAEVYFVYSLQTHNPSLLETIFNTTGYGYYASSGRVFGRDGHKYFETVNNQSVSIRCVYDYWYWGDETVDVHKYTPKP